MTWFMKIYFARQNFITENIALTTQEDRDNFLNTALDEYKRCIVIGDKYDVRVVSTCVLLHALEILIFWFLENIGFQ